MVTLLPRLTSSIAVISPKIPDPITAHKPSATVISKNMLYDLELTLAAPKERAVADAPKP